MTAVNERFAVGQKIRFAEERKAYTVRAIGERFAVLTKPFNAKRTVLYTIVDTMADPEGGWRNYGYGDMMRGPHNLIFNPYDFATDEGCNECLAALVSGDIELSRRRSIPVVLSS